MPIYLGVDPGAKGSLCLLDTDSKTFMFEDTPGPTNTALNVFNWLEQHCQEVTMAAIENVHSLHKMSAKSNFQFGFNVGQLHGILGATGIGFDLIQPKVWQKGVGVPVQKPKTAPAVRKKAIAEVALRLYPNAPLYGPRGGLLDGRTDALMIAHYLSIKYGGNTLS